MTPRNLLLALGVIVVFAASSRASGDYFVVEYDAIVYLKPVGGSSAGDTEFGIGTSIQDHIPIFRGLPNHTFPNKEVRLGFVKAGTPLHFYQMTRWNQKTYWAFSNGNDRGSLVAFYDRDNSLGLGGSTVEDIGDGVWLMHLDNAASILYDDDDNDILMQIRLVPLSP